MFYSHDLIERCATSTFDWHTMSGNVSTYAANVYFGEMQIRPPAREAWHCSFIRAFTSCSENNNKQTSKVSPCCFQVQGSNPRNLAPVGFALCETLASLCQF